MKANIRGAHYEMQSLEDENKGQSGNCKKHLSY